MQAAFFEAVVNTSHRLLGRRLHDFCLYDALFLTLTNNPLWLGHRDVTAADLETAALICSLPPERLTRAQFEPQNFCERVCRYAWQLRSAERFEHHLDDELAAWRAYLADFDSRPEMWGAGGKGRPLKAPWILSLACYIEMNSNMREREIMTAPIGLMFWKAQTIAERLGQSVADMMTEEEIAMAREQEAALEAAGEVIPKDDTEDGEAD